MANKGLTRIIRFVLDRKSSAETTSRMEAEFQKAGIASGKSFYRELKASLDKTTAELREKLARGVIDEKEFKKQSEIAARAFNNALLRAMDEARKKGELTDREFVKLSRTLKKVGDDGAGAGFTLSSAFNKVAATIGAAFALDRVVAFVKGSVDAAIESEAIWNRVAGAVRRAGGDWDGMSAAVKRTADELRNTAAVGDEEFGAALDTLLAKTGDVTLSVSQMGFVADIAARFYGGDLVQAADTLGLILEGNVRVFKSLGIVTKDVNEGLRILRERAQGAAQNELNTLEGKIRLVKEAFGDARKELGFFILRLAGGSDSAEVNVNRYVLALDKLANWFATHKFTGWTNSGGPIPIPTFGKIDQPKAQKSDSLDKTGVLDPLIVTAKTAETLREEAKKAAQEAADARAKEVEGLKKGFELRTLTNKEIEHAIELQRQLAEEALNPKLSIAARNTAREQAISLSGIGFAPPVKPGIVDHGLRTPAAPLIGVDTSANEQAAEDFASPWTKALDAIHEAASEQGGIFEQLGQAWAQGGLKGLAQLAAAKVKENLALAFEWGARALGFLVSGDGVHASLAGKTAAGFALSAAKWKLAAVGLGAAAGGGGGSSAGNLGSVGNLAGSAADSSQPKSETHIYLGLGLEAKNPAVVRTIGGIMKEAQRTDSSVIIHKGQN